MFAERNTTGNRTPVQPLNSFFSVFPVRTGEGGRIQETSGAFFIGTVEMVAAAGGGISLEISAAQRLEKLPEKQRHMNSQELFFNRRHHMEHMQNNTYGSSEEKRVSFKDGTHMKDIDNPDGRMSPSTDVYYLILINRFN